jgi:hypothetical protein
VGDAAVTLRFLVLLVVATAAIACSTPAGGSAAPASPAGPGTTNAGSQAAPESAGPAGGSAGVGGDCVIGGTVTEINGKPARVFCGPATATVTVGGADLDFKDGACEFLGSDLTVNLGTTVIGETTGPDYFGLTAFGVDNLPLTEMPAITWVKDGTSAFLSGSPTPTLTISDDKKTIEFSGSVGGGGEASGVIHC